ncbi:MAG: ATP-binding protein [Limnobacter sp.]|uniref:sensor histidine kinase n=1 Tax=Limnobacter sp. TaxID=2003368 RepID=UPI003919CF7E
MKWPQWTLTRRIGAMTAGLLLVTGLASVLVQVKNSERHANEVLQRISLTLASHIAESNKAMLTPDGLNSAATQRLFDRLMEVNPSVEVYLLDRNGQIITDAAPPNSVKKSKVDLNPIRTLLSGKSLPVLGDDPRNPTRQKVFSVTPLQYNGQDWGYLYIILAGQEYDQVSRNLVNLDLWKLSWMGMLTVLVMGMISAWLALRWVTKPLRRLTQQVGTFRVDSQHHIPSNSLHPTGTSDISPPDEISQLQTAFQSMTERITRQWQQLNEFDQQRRELVANISHDLRTPLTSLHGYLETLKFKAGSLSAQDKDRYLDIALSQSKKVGNLAQALFELARLEHGGVKPHKEDCSLVDLLQDVVQKFELATEARRQTLRISLIPDLPVVQADLGLIERVLTNLIDNAIRHTNDGCQIRISAETDAQGVYVSVEDDGPGLPLHVKQTVFQEHQSTRAGWRLTGASSSGLGLMIVRKILQLHDSDLDLGPEPRESKGTKLGFRLYCLPA